MLFLERRSRHIFSLTQILLFVTFLWLFSLLLYALILFCLCIFLFYFSFLINKTSFSYISVFTIFSFSFIHILRISLISPCVTLYCLCTHRCFALSLSMNRINISLRRLRKFYRLPQLLLIVLKTYSPLMHVYLI